MRCEKKLREDRQRRPASARCGRCGRDLYPGDSCWYVGGALLCRGCLLDYALGFFAPHREEVDP